MFTTLLRLGHIPTGMELWPGSDLTVWAAIERALRDCDFYIVVVGGRYGEVDEQGVSYTEREYELARKLNIPVLSFIRRPILVTVDLTDGDPVLAELLERFKGKLRTSYVAEWDNAGMLASEVALALIAAIDRHDAVGFIRANEAPPEMEAELSQLRATVLRLTGEVAKARERARPDWTRLAHGEDHHAITVSVVYRDSGPRTRTTAEELTVTWDEIFAALGALDDPEASEEEMAVRLQKVAAGKLRLRMGSNVDVVTIRVPREAIG